MSIDEQLLKKILYGGGYLYRTHLLVDNSIDQHLFTREEWLRLIELCKDVGSICKGED